MTEHSLPDVLGTLEAGNFNRAMYLLEGMTYEQLLNLSLPAKRTPLHYACQHGRVGIAEQLITDYKAEM